MNNKTFKRVVALVASALMLCSCAFAATIGNVTYDIATGKIAVNYTADGASKAAIMVTKADGTIVAVNQHDSIKEAFNETLDTTKVAAGDVLTIKVGDNAAGSEEAASTTFEVVAPVVKYTVTFVDEDGTELQSSKVVAGEMPTLPAEPTKAETDEYTYAFAGWTPEVVAAAADATYTATYTATKKEYAITFVDEDGTVLSTVNVAYGETPVYAGENPVKAEDDKYTYAFAGWTPEIVAVTGAATYTATYEATAKPVIPDAPETFTVTFISEGAEYAKVENVAAGTAISTKVPAEPTKAASGKKRYAFIGWYLDDAFATKMADNTVAADTTLYAKFSLIGIHGDATTDCNVNALDVIEIKKYLKDKTGYVASNPTKAYSLVADCVTSKNKTARYGDATADGNINALDVIEIKKYLKNKTGYTGTAATDMTIVKD